MSHPIRDRLRELETDVQDLRVLPAAEVRAHGRRRGRRQMVTATVALAVVVAGGVTATTTWAHRHGAANVPAAARVTCVLTLPEDPADVTVRMVDGGAAAGRVDATATGLKNRRFTVLNPHDGPPGDRVAGSATLHYGPAAIGAASLLRAWLRGDTTMWFDPDRSGATVDLLVGPTFAGFATTTGANQAMVAAGEPSAPPACSTNR
jgi:hypothetical protein